MRDLQASDAIKAGTPYVAPEGRVLVGYSHNGDVNGETRYLHARMVVVTTDGVYDTSVDSGSWVEINPRRGSNFEFVCPSGEALVGRLHSGDESEQVRSARVTVHINGTEYPLSFTSGAWITAGQESEHDVRAPEGQVLIGQRQEQMATADYRFATPTV
ncbi:hypothetical protein JNW98_22180 [Streptomyces sp. SCA2-4]|nr:hypothetical protein [Streptomyces huiliensis]